MFQHAVMFAYFGFYQYERCISIYVSFTDWGTILLPDW